MYEEYFKVIKLFFVIERYLFTHTIVARIETSPVVLTCIHIEKDKYIQKM